MRRSLGSSLR